MKLGVAGAGMWGKNLIKQFSEMGVLSGVADAVEENRHHVQEIAPEIELYESHQELLKNNYDAVAIATPAPTHFPIAVEAMQAGCDVFIEKPMTLDSKEAAELVVLAKKLGKVLMVGHLLLYQPAIGFIKNYVSSGKLGKLHALHQRRSKLGRVRSVENVLWSFGVHDVAVLLYLAEELPTTLKVNGGRYLQSTVEDDVFLHLDFKSGLKVHLHNSWMWPRMERELIVIGEKGMLVYDELKHQVILYQKTVQEDLSHIDEGEILLFEGSGQPLRIELEHFVDCCLKRIKPISDGENGLAVVRVLEEAEKVLSSN